MAPARIEFEHPDRDPEPVDVEVGKESEKLDYVKPVNIVVGCINNSVNHHEGILEIKGPFETVIVSKFYSQNDQQGTLITPTEYPIRFAGDEIIRVKARFYDESLRLSVSQPHARKEVGKIPPGYQPA